MLRHPAERVSCDLRINNLFILNENFVCWILKSPNKVKCSVMLGIIYVPFHLSFHLNVFWWKKYVYYTFRLHPRCFLVFKIATLVFRMHKVRRAQERYFLDYWQHCRAGFCGRAWHFQKPKIHYFTNSSFLYRMNCHISSRILLGSCVLHFSSPRVAQVVPESVEQASTQIVNTTRTLPLTWKAVSRPTAGCPTETNKGQWN